MRIATDVGGTFTDLVAVDDGPGGDPTPLTVKCDSTPPHFERGVQDVLQKAAIDPSAIDFFAHGSTVIINAITERKGARTGLITTRGFRDVLEIARGNRPDLYNLMYAKPKPFVPRFLRQEITERVSHAGKVLTPLAEDELAEIVETFRSEGVEAIAISLLHAYANPAHETAIRDALHNLWPEVSVVPSHTLTREWREYERTSTTVLAAYTHPLANQYLDALKGSLHERGFTGNAYVMQSNGGITTLESAKDRPISMMESGPAGGVLGAMMIGRLIGEQNLITLDVGGTTAKCALVQYGQMPITTDYTIERTPTYAGYPLKLPSIDIVEIGSGGGSIATLDDGNKLRVGPQSAGASPGPAAYGRGGNDPTTTDAHLITGRIDQNYFLGGEITPDMDNVRRVFAELSNRLGMETDETARGIIRLANANMTNALKLVSVNRGHDPREFTLVAYGGGGAMHAVALARELHIPKVIIPPHPAVFSAWGMLMSDMRRDYIRTRPIRLDAGHMVDVQAAYHELEGAAREDFASDNVALDRLRIERFADMRYDGQEHTVKVAFPSGPIDGTTLEAAQQRFHAEHERAFTFRLDVPVITVNFHIAAFSMVNDVALPDLVPVTGSPEEAIRESRVVDFDIDGRHEAPIYERARLGSGTQIAGPAVIEEPDTTIVLPPDLRATVDQYGLLRVDVTGVENRDQT
jgi:N-methylhydantoinase A